ncbi:hypothetical protein [Spirosoma flavum]|uniref:Uncharacterized protein n=1 Tax=Spirosoma flavum TaxID=2048557 RepID=A0ABW6ASR2_9BACT
MKPEELKQQALKNDIDSLSNKVVAVSNTLERLTDKIDANSKANKAGFAEKLEGWIKNLTLFLSIPGIVVVLFIQLKQPENVTADTQAKLADARQKNAEALKLENEIQLSFDSIKRKSSKDVAAYNELLDDKLPKLQNIISRFETVRIQNQSQNLIFKYIILWIIFVGLGWFFGLFSTFWSSLIALAFFILNKRAEKIKIEKNRKRFRNISQYSIIILSPLPTILKIIVEISIFFALMIPIFNETAILLGSDKSFQSVSKEFSKFHIEAAIDSVKQIIDK